MNDVQNKNFPFLVSCCVKCEFVCRQKPYRRNSLRHRRGNKSRPLSLFASPVDRIKCTPRTEASACVTWTGTVLKVVRTTSLHWCSLSPCPPTCSAAWWTTGRLTPTFRPTPRYFLSLSGSGSAAGSRSFLSPARPWWSRWPRCSHRRGAAARNPGDRPCFPTAWCQHSTYANKRSHWKITSRSCFFLCCSISFIEAVLILHWPGNV